MIDEAKNQLGIMSLNEALRLAQGKGLDLVEIAPNAVPPVCRIVNYGRFLYEESKRESNSRQAAGRMKEVQISPTIDPHDLATKRGQVVKFLCEDMKVRLKLRFHGRQKAHKEIGFEVVNKLVLELAEYGRADAPPKMLGDRDLNVVLSPLPRNKRPQNAPPPSAPPGADSTRPGKATGQAGETSNPGEN